MYTHIDEVAPKEIVPGVLERELLSFDQSATKELRATHYVITDGVMKFEGANIEYQHYIISGCGLWRGQLVHTDSALFVPSNRNPHSIQNMGENPLRVITHAYKLPTPNFKWAKAAFSQLYQVNVEITTEVLYQQIFTEGDHALLGARRAHAVDVQTHPPHGTKPIHTNPEETMYFLRGWGEALSEDVRFNVKPGSFVYTPEGATMGIFNTNETNPLQYICMEFAQVDKSWSNRGYQGTV